MHAILINCVLSWSMELFNEKLTNRNHSFSDCILEIQNVSIRLTLNVYEHNNWLS